MANVGSRPRSFLSAFASRGRSRSTSCRCRAIVAVEITTVSSSATACLIDGTRYASDLPVPVPACTARCSPVRIERSTASAISTWPGRSAPPTAWTAVSSRLSVGGTSGTGQTVPGRSDSPARPAQSPPPPHPPPQPLPQPPPLSPPPSPPLSPPHELDEHPLPQLLPDDVSR